MTICPLLFVSLFNVGLHKGVIFFFLFSQTITSWETFSTARSLFRGNMEAGGSWL